MKKGTVRFLKHNNFDHLYVKVDDEEFGWWRLENLQQSPDRRMMVRMDKDNLNHKFQSQFTILSAHGICVDLSNNMICVITNKTSNSVEVYMRRVSDRGVDCKSWVTQKDFEKNYFVIPIDIVKQEVEEPIDGLLTERMDVKSQEFNKYKEILSERVITLTETEKK